MIARIRLFLLTFAISICASVSVHAATFQESGGVVVIEAESSSAKGSWSKESKIGGAKGGSYLIWKGPDLFSGKSAGRDTLRYTFRIQKAGNYELKWRTYIGHANTSTEANDSWVRFPTGKNIGGQHPINGWTKVFQNQPKQWSWSAKTVDNVGKSVRQYFSKGDHVMEVSGRSNGHAIDRIVLFQYGSVSFSEGKFNGYPASKTVGGSQPPQNTQPEPEPEPAPEPEPNPEPEPAPAPKPEPKPEPEPAPAPKPEPKPEPEPEPESQPQADAPAKAAAPVVSLDGNTLRWDRVNAVAINVHGNNGEWLESLSGSSTEWTAQQSGNYYVVATNNESWEYWGRSNTVSVEIANNAPSTSGNDGLNVTGAVYSSSAIEIFWTNTAVSPGTEYRVSRNGQQVFSGNAASFFDSGLSAGTSYVYQLAAYDAGQLRGQQEISLTTLGGADGASASNTGVPAVSGLRGTVYSQSAIELSWDRSSADNIVAYKVYQDGQQVSSSDALSYFVDGLSAETTYVFEVRVQDVNGNDSEARQVTLTTFTADGSSVASFGPPASDASAEWSALAEGVRQAMPTDCILAVSNSVAYCYSNRDNRLLAKRTSDAQSLWSYQLKAGTRVEAISVDNNGNLALIARDGACNTCSNYSISNISPAGANQWTLPAFNDASQANNVAINLDGSTLRVLGQDASGMRVAGKRYLLIDGADASSSANWYQAGVMLMVVNATTGATQSSRVLENMSLEEVTLADF